MLGTTQTHLQGFEVGLTLQLNELRTSLTYYYFGGDLKGISHSQVVAGFAVSSALLRGPIH
jgi:hypothetical protein